MPDDRSNFLLNSNLREDASRRMRLLVDDLGLDELRGRDHRIPRAEVLVELRDVEPLDPVLTNEDSLDLWGSVDRGVCLFFVAPLAIMVEVYGWVILTRSKRNRGERALVRVLRILREDDKGLPQTWRCLPLA